MNCSRHKILIHLALATLSVLIALSQIQTAYAEILALEHSEEWFTIDYTYVYSVFAGDVDGDGVVEIVTGGVADDGTRYNGQLRIWAFLPPPVGGTVTPVNRLQLLAPLIYFTSLGFIAAAVALKRYRR